MKRASAILLVVILFFPMVWAVAEEDEKNSIPVGMEKIKVGGNTLVVPRGAIVKKRGDLIVIEASHEYVARKIYEMEKRLAAMEAREEESRKEIKRISEALSRMQEGRTKPDAKN